MKNNTLILCLFMLPLITLTACGEFQLNEHMQEATFLVNGGEYNKQGGTTRRAWLTLIVKGLNGDSVTLDYTIDEKPGTGDNALQVIDQAFKGSSYLSEEAFSGQYEGNFPSGRQTSLCILIVEEGKLPSSGKADFLSPKLEAGKHTIKYTVTNSNGEKITNSREFTIEDDADKKDK